MNFDDAITAHSQWKIRLLNVINGTSQESLDPQVIAIDNKCALGQWIYNEAHQYSQLPEYTELVQEHAIFHKCASEVLRKALAGQTEMAKQDMSNSGPFMDASIHTINAIRHLRRKVEKS
jgi:Chemoreceptor zinc-binding domain